MHVVTNEKLVRNRFRLGTGFHITALVILGIGLYLSLSAPMDTSESVRVFAPYAALIVFLIPYYFGKHFLQRYSPKSRADGALAQAGKGLDNRYSLLAFPSASLPDYLLVGPSGVFVLIPRPHRGTLVCHDNRWQQENVSGLSRFYTSIWGTPLGDPTGDAEKGVAKVRRELERQLAGDADAIPVSGLIVFTDPNAKLRQEAGCSMPATTLKNLKSQVRGRSVLPGAQVARARDALVEPTR